MNKATTQFNITPSVPVSTAQPVRALVAGFEKSGKTYNAIKWALLYCGIDVTGWTATQVADSAPSSPVVVIETSREDVSVYAKVLPFRMVQVPSALNNPANITQIIKAYESDPSIKAIVVDSYSEFWEGEGGVLGIVESLKASTKDGIGAWAQIKKLETKQLDAMRDSRLDLWFTVRMKDGIIVEKEDNGTTSVTKERDKPVQRRSAPYEFSQLYHLEAQGDKLYTTFFGRYIGAGEKSMNGTKFQTDNRNAMLKFHKGLSDFLDREIAS